MGELLRMEEVASILQVSYMQARQLIVVEKVIPSCRVGSRGIRVDHNDLDKYIAKIKKEAKSGTR